MQVESELCAVRLHLSSDGGKNLLGNDMSVDGVGMMRLRQMDGAELHGREELAVGK